MRTRVIKTIIVNLEYDPSYQNEDHNLDEIDYSQFADEIGRVIDQHITNAFLLETTVSGAPSIEVILSRY